ncbi:IS66 family transposase zinc-finger binding domain-containing protein [Paraburkholderia phytofirmans]|uniref:IS66 family transposase zinc-finger binding domain-containing protein n=1 Tax=Paraburkholderia phytofirmans TaxID=261302 RepID=UPI0038B92A50
MKQIGEDISEQLEVPKSFGVVRHVRPKFACTCCDHIAQASVSGCPSSVVWQARDCWRMCSWRSSPIIYHFAGSQLSMLVKASSLSVQRWLGVWP